MNTESTDTVWCEIKLQDDDKLVIGVVYRSPNVIDQQNTDIINSIKEIR